MAAPQPVAQNYTQPIIDKPGSGWRVNCLDYQIVTKSDGWNQDQTKRLTEYQAGKDLSINYAAIAVPYDNLTKYTNYVADARTKGLKVNHRAHWNAWEGDNGIGDIATPTSLTRSGNTATCVTNTAHGLSTGDTVSLNGMNETDYRGEFTVTVTNSTTFTYPVANSPTSPATGSIGWRFGRQTYLDHTYDFIVANASLFAAGDIFCLCVEAQQAANNGCQFFTQGTTTFSYTLYNQFLKDQVRYANAAFTAIGLGGLVTTNLISFGISNLNLNGQTLDSGDAGNAGGLGDSDIVTYFNSVLCIDHYLSSSYRAADSTKYWTWFSSDLDKIHTAFPSCKLFIGEWGYHTETSVGDAERAGMFHEVVKVLRTKTYILGVSFWNHMGQTSSSIFTDNSGTLVTDGLLTPKEVKLAFSGGNSAFGQRIRVV